MSKNRPQYFREGTRVMFSPSKLSHCLYTDPPALHATGTVTKLSLGNRKSEFLDGPGGGLNYVKWDDGSYCGVAPMDLIRLYPGIPSKASKEG